VSDLPCAPGWSVKPVKPLPLGIICSAGQHRTVIANHRGYSVRLSWMWPLHAARVHCGGMRRQAEDDHCKACTHGSVVVGIDSERGPTSTHHTHLTVVYRYRSTVRTRADLTSDGHKVLEYKSSHQARCATPVTLDHPVFSDFAEPSLGAPVADWRAGARWQAVQPRCQPCSPLQQSRLGRPVSIV